MKSKYIREYFCSFSSKSYYFNILGVSHLNSHYSYVIVSAMASQITRLTIFYTTVYSGTDEWKHQRFASLAFVRGNSPATGEFTTQMASNAENVSTWWRPHFSPGQNGRHFADDIFNCIFLKENIWIAIKLHWNLYPMSHNGLAPNKRQAFFWINVGPLHWLIYAAAGGDEFGELFLFWIMLKQLTSSIQFYKCKVM